MFEEFPVKLTDTKCYVGLDGLGKPQLIRVEPMFSTLGQFLPQSVVVYVDEVPALMDRGTAEALIASTVCTPREINAQYNNYWTH